MISGILIYKASVFTFLLHGPEKLQGVRTNTVFSDKWHFQSGFHPPAWLCAPQIPGMAGGEGRARRATGLGQPRRESEGKLSETVRPRLEGTGKTRSDRCTEDALALYLLIPVKTPVVYVWLEDTFHKDFQVIIQMLWDVEKPLTLEVWYSPSSSQPLENTLGACESGS